MQAPKRPSGMLTSSIIYMIRYGTVENLDYYSTVSYYNSSHSVGDQLSYTLTHLSRDTEYVIEIAMQVSHSACYYSYIYGNYSDPVFLQTNATREQTYTQNEYYYYYSCMT